MPQRTAVRSICLRQIALSAAQPPPDCICKTHGRAEPRPQSKWAKPAIYSVFGFAGGVRLAAHSSSALPPNDTEPPIESPLTLPVKVSVISLLL